MIWEVDVRDLVIFLVGAFVMFVAFEGYVWLAARRDVRRVRKDRSR